MAYKVLVVDDHFVVREGLKLILETEDIFEVVAEAENGKIALEFLEKNMVDVILLDLKMPLMDGLTTLERMNEKNISIPVIILTTYNEDDLMVKGIELGAKGYLLKDTSRDNLFRTLESAIRGETLLQPDIINKLMKFKRNHTSNYKNGAANLTEKEIFILQAIARGFKSREIAHDMGIAERTVKAHLTNVYNKLGVNSRTEAVAIALEKGIFHL
ncbi:response regulator transcription factor [Lysinibacillus capsici]|uniref:Response regulator transcription factor n=1 Tax=Lysinibacillus capsici TaxID=2115968 RepID=A0ABY8KGC3_9BACI|nr:response regulator transcription factor [Lysinibacillus capsici]MDP1395151.1 response regulator transcription factor [Lysinibacillus capsici]MDP1415350.1 response regulator transcription factor [Lysinibacillus capsici]MDP1431514.1 response regulator transcription factor [Lysinibacillus capsici]WGF36871.1 response regulator transcription factor [Lysinibacillus capsici]